MHPKNIALSGLLALSLSACATYETDRYHSAVDTEINARTGFSLPETALPAAPLTGTITPEAAARAALRHNRVLQAALEDLNVAAASEMEAGLLLNPVLGGEIIFEGDGEPAMLDFSLAFNLGRLLTINKRKQAARADRQALQTEVTEAIVAAIIEAKRAVNDLWLAERALEAANERLLLRTSASNAALVLHDAGNITDGALAAAQLVAQQAKLDQSAAQISILEARERLANATGTPLAENVTAMPTDIAFTSPRSDFITAVIDKSLSLEASRAALAAAGARLGLAEMGPWFDHLETEALLEREDGETSPGIGAAIPLPLFDTGSARSGKARAFLAASEHRYQAQLIMTRNRAQTLYSHVALLRSLAEEQQEKLLETADGKYAFDTQLFNAMQTGPMQLITAREQWLDAVMRANMFTYQYREAAIAAEAMKAGFTVALESVNAFQTNSASAAEGDH